MFPFQANNEDSEMSCFVFLLLKHLKIVPLIVLFQKVIVIIMFFW